MKLTQHFADFLAETVNLNDTRLQSLDDSVKAVKNYLRASDWEPSISSFFEQGSWAHRTIIKPVDGGEFDADLIVFVHHVDGWDAADYVNSLYDAFRASGTYKEMVRRWSHCVTITYANDKKIDVAPCVVDRWGVEQFEVCNRDSNEFQRSEPIKYTDWLIEKNSYSGANSFRKVTRLLKYLRDIKTTFTCASVLLTTLVANEISANDVDNPDFSDVPTAIKTLISRLNDRLGGLQTKPRVTNPFLYQEDFADAWTDDQFRNFRDMIAKYRNWIVDAYDEADRDKSIAKWRRVFGDDFAKDVVVNEAKSVGAKALTALNKALLGATVLSGDLVSLVKRLGVSALPPGFSNLPHMQLPTWPQDRARFTVNVSAALYESRTGSRIATVGTMEALSGRRWLRFVATAGDGTSLTNGDYDTWWRVTNTDEEATNAKALRGDFYESTSAGIRWESLKYHGVHMVEAFVLDHRTGRLVGQSPPFYVVIE